MARKPVRDSRLGVPVRMSEEAHREIRSVAAMLSLATQDGTAVTMRRVIDMAWDEFKQHRPDIVELIAWRGQAATVLRVAQTIRQPACGERTPLLLPPAGPQPGDSHAIVANQRSAVYVGVPLGGRGMSIVARIAPHSAAEVSMSRSRRVQYTVTVTRMRAMQPKGCGCWPTRWFWRSATRRWTRRSAWPSRSRSAVSSSSADAGS